MLDVFVVAVVASIVALPPTIALLHRRGTLDAPNVRSSHVHPTVRGGGAALVIGGGIAVAVAGGLDAGRTCLGFGCAALGLGAIGAVDDLRGGVGVRLRLLATLAVAAVAATAATTRWSGFAAVAAVVVAVVVVAGFTNTFNFMDGVNGISAATAAAIAGTLWWFADDLGSEPAAAVAAAVMGTSVAFLPFNAVRPWVFLGDVGSYALGGTLALLGVVVVDAGGGLVVAGPFLPYVADTGLTVLRRLRRGDDVTEAHREHAYQRLVDLGWSHVSVAALVAAASAACGLIGIAAADASGVVQALAVAGAGGLSLAYAVVPNAAGGPAAPLCEAVGP